MAGLSDVRIAHLRRGDGRGTPVVRPLSWPAASPAPIVHAGYALDDLDHGIDCEGLACGDDACAREVVIGLATGETARVLAGAATRPASHSPGTIIRACARRSDKAL
jgi:hypothetical protein